MATSSFDPQISLPEVPKPAFWHKYPLSLAVSRPIKSRDYTKLTYSTLPRANARRGYKRSKIGRSSPQNAPRFGQLELPPVQPQTDKSLTPEEIALILNSVKRVHVKMNMTYPSGLIVLGAYHEFHTSLSEDGLIAQFDSTLDHSFSDMHDYSSPGKHGHYFMGNEMDNRPLLVANSPIPSGDELYYFEVQVSHQVFMPNLATRRASGSRGGLGRMVIGYQLLRQFKDRNLDVKETYQCNFQDGRECSHGIVFGFEIHDVGDSDIIGCGIDFQRDSLFIVKNGKKYGKGFFVTRNKYNSYIVQLIHCGRNSFRQFSALSYTCNTSTGSFKKHTGKLWTATVSLRSRKAQINGQYTKRKSGSKCG